MGTFMIAEVADDGVRHGGGRVLVDPLGRIRSGMDLDREVVDPRTDSEVLAAQLGAEAYDHLHGKGGVVVEPGDGRGGIAFSISAPSRAPWVIADCAIRERATLDMSLEQLRREAEVLSARVGIEFDDPTSIRGTMRALVSALRELDAGPE